MDYFQIELKGLCFIYLFIYFESRKDYIDYTIKSKTQK